MKRCPETGDECIQRYSCEHTAKGRVVICMKANVRRWINQEPPFNHGAKDDCRTSTRNSH